MASSNSTWRIHPFENRHVYTARESFSGFPESEFIEGHDYVFEGVAYSHYDSCTVFTFRELGKDQPVCWWWSDDEPESLCQVRFNVCDGKSA